jgi:hypothetical protein
MFVALVAALAAIETAAPDFSQTFTPGAVASHLDANGAALVVGAGPASEALAQATAALEAALRGSGRVDFVLNGKTLGDVGGLDDPTIVKKCAALPVERVVVVRVFESAGQPARAVATLYDKQGALVTAFTGVAGTALAAKSAPAEGAPPSTGLSQNAAKAVLETGPEKGGVTARNQYDEQYIGFEERTVVTVMSGVGMVSNWSKPVLGKYRKPLHYEDFYKMVERPDLASSYETRRAVRIGFWAAGIATIAVTTAVAIGSLASRDSCDSVGVSSPKFSTCVEESGAKLESAVKVALIGGGVGTLLVLVPFAINPQPIEPDEARRLADGYNEKLKAKLGIAQADWPSPSTKVDSSLALSVSFFRGAGSGGILLGAHF